MSKEKEHAGGRIAANFRRANIAEGIAIQLFRPFAAIANVPRDEDYGIDFIGTLICREGRVLVAKNSFITQVKIASSPEFLIQGDGVEWLRNLQLPYFPVVVDMDAGKISIYSLNRYHHVFYASAVTKYNFVVQNEHCEGDRHDDFPLGDPIMEWTLSDATHPSFGEWAYKVFSQFVMIESNNFKYGRLLRFEHFKEETFRFDTSNAGAEVSVIEKAIFELPFGDGEKIREMLGTVINPFVYWISNQVYDVDKSDSVLKLRDSLRELDFNADPGGEWDEIAVEMKKYAQKVKH